MKANGYEVVWSPDARWLALTSWTRDGSSSIHVYAADGSASPRVLTSAGSNPAWSPDSSTIAFMRDGGVWAIRLDGTQETPLLRPQLPVISELRWGPGNIIALRSFAQSGIYVAKDDGSNERYIAPGFAPEWSPAGNRIAFTSGETGLGFSGRLYASTPDGAEVNRLGSISYGDVPMPCLGASSFSWAPDGKSLAYWTLGSSPGGADKTQLFSVLDTATAKPRLLDAGLDPGWSSDSKRVVYSKGRGFGFFDCDVYAIDDTGAAPVLLVADARAPQWSPAGEWIAVDSSALPSSGPRIRVVAADGSGNRAQFAGRAPVWSPDGKRLAFIRMSTQTKAQIVVANLDGAESVIVEAEQYGDNRQGFRAVAWSPDGTRLAYDVSAADDRPSIFVAAADGSTPPKRLLAGRNPTWSPDGASIAYAR
jgi:TolB protein